MRRLFAVLGVVGVATAAGGGVGHRSPKSVATIRGPVGQFAQSSRYLAWMTPPKSPDARPASSQCEVMLTFLDLRTGSRLLARGTGDPPDLLGCYGPEDSMALEGRRAYWQAASSSNLSIFEDLITEAAGQAKSRDIDFQSIDKSNVDSLVPVSSDGSSVYAVSSPDDGTPGPIRRWVGVHGRAVSDTIRRLTALGAGGGRFAFAGTLNDCANQPAWSASTGEIAFSRGRSSASLCPGGIWVMNADGTSPRRIATVGAHPDWSPNGSKLAFDNGTHVVVANSNGSSPHRLLEGRDPAWSPDGSQLAFDRAGALYVANADGQSVRQVRAHGLEPAWSPDGTQIVFARPFGKTQGLGIVNADGSGYRSLTISRDTDPAWSPNGRWIAYRRTSYDAIRLVAPDGTSQRALSSRHYIGAQAPAWSPDSYHLVIVAEDDQGDSGLVSENLGSSNGGSRLTKPPTGASISLDSHLGSLLGRFVPNGRVDALAVSESILAALIIDSSGTRIEIFLPRRRTLALARPPTGEFRQLSASGATIIYHIGRAIYALDARKGTPHIIAYAASEPIGLSIVERRVAWAESGPHASRIYTITLP